MTTTTASFNGDRSKWNQYDLSKQAEAKAALPGVTDGILRLWISEAEWLAGHPGSGPLVLHANPGKRPEIVLNIMTTSNLQLAVHSAESKTYDYNLLMYTNQEAAIEKLKAKILSELPEESLLMITHPITGTMNITLREIRAILVAAYGTLHPTDVDKLVTELNKPYQAGTCMLTFINARKQKLAEIKSTGEEYSPATLNRMLIASLGGQFAATVRFWTDINNTGALQVTNADDLPNRLVKAYNESKLVPEVTRSSMNAVQFNEAFELRVQAAVAAGIAAAALSTKANKNTAGTGGTGLCKTCGAKVTEKGKSGRVNTYCSHCYAKYKAERAVA